MGAKGKFVIEIGKVYGSWKVLEYAGKNRYPNGNVNHLWKGMCTLCGAESTRLTSTIRARKSKGCMACLVVEDCAIKRAYRSYRRQAENRHIGFDLSYTVFKKIVVLDCHYCGRVPEVNSYSMDCKVQVPMTGVDRRDSALSYTVSNCIPCCSMCNLGKLTYSESDFLGWVMKIAGYQTSKPTIDPMAAIISDNQEAGPMPQFFRRNLISCGSPKYARGNTKITVNPSFNQLDDWLAEMETAE